MAQSAFVLLLIAGICAGTANGLFGAGGGMLLVPLLTIVKDIPEESVFPSSVSIILPITVLTLLSSQQPIDFYTALPYLLGSLIGGVAAGFFGKRIPVKWLHRSLGLLILWGGVRYLC